MTDILKHKKVVIMEEFVTLTKIISICHTFIAFHMAGQVNEALRVLQQLTKNAIRENRFKDAAYYCWILSRQLLELASSTSDDQKRSHFLKKHSDLEKRTDIYYTYHHIHRFVVRSHALYVQSLSPFIILFWYNSI